MPATRSLALFEPAGTPAANEATAQAESLARAQPSAERLCRNFGTGSLYRFVSASPRAEQWSCKRERAGISCGFDGTAECKLEVRQRTEQERPRTVTGERPDLFGVEPPRPRLEAVRSVDMTGSNAWADLAASFRQTCSAHKEHEEAKAGLKKLVPEDAREASGHGLRAKRSKTGAISFELLKGVETANAPL